MSDCILELWDRCSIRTLGNILHANIEHSIVQGSAHQELQTQIVDSLAICEGLSLLCAVPIGDQSVAEGQTGSCVCGRLVAIEHATSKSGLDMANHLLFEILLARKWLCLEFLPCLALWFGDGSCVTRAVNSKLPLIPPR